MEQGSHMQVRLQSSRRGRAACGLVYGMLVLLLLQADFAPALLLLAQSLLAWAVWSGYRSTVGLGRGAVTISRVSGDWHITGAGRPGQRIAQVRAGFVRPWLLSAQLRCEHGSVSLLAFDDATDADSHWVLRSLALKGIPPQNGAAEMPEHREVGR